MTRIQSKPSKFYSGEKRKIEFFIDIEGQLMDKNVVTAISQLYSFANRVTEVGTPEVPWFPTRIEDFDQIGNKILGEGEGIQEADHPSFRDPVYRKRREMIANAALEYKLSDSEVPRIKYSDEEASVWQYCYPKLKDLCGKYACEESN